jgi:hypothetical protein
MINILLFLGWGIAVVIVGILILSIIETFISKLPKPQTMLKVKPQTIYAGTEEEIEFFN